MKILVSLTVFNWQSGQEYLVEMTMFNVQRAISKSRQIRATAHMFCIASYNVLYLREASLKYQKRYQSYGADTSTW